MRCVKCQFENSDSAAFCKNCGTPLRHQLSIVYPPQPNYVYVPPAKKAYSWRDISTVTGFVCALLGFINFWIVLCPVGLFLSFLGFRADKTKGLAVAGIIIAITSMLVKIGLILADFHLPDWVVTGIFG